MKVIPLLSFVITPILLTSCVVPVVPSGGGTSTPVQPANEVTNLQWNLRPNGQRGYELDAIVNGQTKTVGSGGEFFDNKPIAAGTDEVPSSALSGYVVPGPDGESSLFYAQQLGRVVQVFRRDWNPDPTMGATGYGPNILAATFTR